MAIITMIKDRINQLNQASFQILCDALLAREGYPGIVALGTKDGAEKTTPGTPDTYFCLSGGKYVFGVPGMAHISEVETYLQPRAVTPKA